MSILADQMGFGVTYHGVSPVGQHLFANGEAVVTDVYNTIEEGIERFGKRIEIDSRQMSFSVMYRKGHEAALAGQPYAPENKDYVAIKEYGMGFIKGAVARAEPPEPEIHTSDVAPEVVIDEPLIVEPDPAPPPEVVEVPPAPIKKKRGKGKTKAKLKPADQVMSID